MGLTTEEQKAVQAFRDEIVEPSMTKLVIVDFWAEWCGPCKQLTPVIEKVAADYADKGVVLAKINVDENKFIAAQFQIRSIPTVYAMFQGQPVADLSNARTEPQLSAMLDQLLAKLPVQAGAVADSGPSLDEVANAGLEALAEGANEEAYAIFTEVLGHDPEHKVALAGMLDALIALDRAQEAQSIFASLTDVQRADPAMERVGTKLSIVAEARDPEELRALRAAVDADPANQEARFDLANALMAAGDRDGAADTLLASIAADREWNGGAARSRLLEIFSMIGLEDPWVAATRRKLSAILFG
ncbi:MAG TPA: tetratricopeptide repeat protein [Sphingorhabdus sp.]|nr:tetratricopeptide repeat protein [Sphingorhabdus sp.]